MNNVNFRKNATATMSLCCFIESSAASKSLRRGYTRRLKAESCQSRLEVKKAVSTIQLIKVSTRSKPDEIRLYRLLLRATSDACTTVLHRQDFLMHRTVKHELLTSDKLLNCISQCWLFFSLSRTKALSLWIAGKQYVSCVNSLFGLQPMY